MENLKESQKSGNKDFTIDLTSRKKQLRESLFSHWNLNGIFFSDFMIHLLNSLAALVGGYSSH